MLFRSVHGGERRALPDLDPPNLPADIRLDPARDRLRQFCAQHPRVVLEDKSIAIAIHFRAEPAAATALEQSLRTILTELGPGFHALHGSMVVEIKPRGFTKARAIEEFLRQPPFRNRTPIFLGDDITDLDGFGLIEERHGTSIAVGDRVAAQWRLADPAAAREWLSEFAAMSTP